MQIDAQSIIAVLLLVLMVAYITHRYVLKPFLNRESNHRNCGHDCGCDHP